MLTLLVKSAPPPLVVKAGEAETLATEGTEAAEVVEAEGRPEPLEAGQPNLCRTILTKNPTKRAPDTPMGLQVQPVPAIGPKAEARPTAATLLSVDGSTSFNLVLQTHQIEKLARLTSKQI